MLRLLGLPDSNEGITQQQWEACIHPEDRDRVLAEVAANVAGPGALDRQYRVVWPDGTVHWLHSKTRLVLDSFNRPDKLIGVDFDITEHQAADERLRILSSAVEQSPVSIVITNLHGIIEYANRKTTEITGYTLDELRGQHTRILNPATPLRKSTGISGHHPHRRVARRVSQQKEERRVFLGRCAH